VVLASTAIQLLDDRKSPIVAGTCFHISKQYDYIIIYCFLNVLLTKMQPSTAKHHYIKCVFKLWEYKWSWNSFRGNFGRPVGR